MELGGTGIEIGFLYSFMFLVYTFSVLLGGFLADRFDRKKLILHVFIFGSASMLVYSLAVEWWHLLLAMLVYSLATIGGPAEDSYIASLAPREKMARTFTFTEMGYSVGLIFSPLFGAYLLTFLSIRWLFRISFAFSLLSVLTLFFISSQIPSRKKKSGSASSDFYTPLKNKKFILWMPLFMIFAFGIAMVSPFISATLKDIHKLDDSTILIMGSISYAGEAALGMILGGMGSKGIAGKPLCLSLIVVGVGALLFAHSSLLFMIPLAVFLMGGGRVASALARSIAGTSTSDMSAGVTFAVFTVLLGIVQTPAPEIGGILYESSPILLFLVGAASTLAVVPFVLILERHVLRNQ
jgi:MFS family permease